MTEWPAERADQRIAASSARLVRAAIRQSFDPLKVWQAYLATLPESSDNLTMDRVRARAWVIMNVTLNGEAMEAALRRVYAEGYVLGRLSAEQAIQQARAARKAPDSGGIDWDTWRPGNSAAAALLKPPGSLKRLLDNTGVTVRGINRTTMERLGNALADTLALGVGEKAGAKIIGAVIADPARALSITITEQARALSAASAEAYRDAGLDEQEWFANDPCAVCAQNAGKVVAIGEAFPSGHTQPPAHPYCRCALLPVIPDFEAEPQAPIRTPEGQPDVLPTEGQITVNKPATEYEPARPGSTLYANGEGNTIFFDAGAKPTEREIAAVVQTMKDLQAVAPVNVDITVGRNLPLVRNQNSLAYATSKFDPVTERFIRADIQYHLPRVRQIATKEGWLMPESADTLRYTVAHEYGHAVEYTLPGYEPKRRAHNRDWLKEMGEAADDMSEYGRTSNTEAFAEAFAEWFMSRGATNNRAAQWFANELGWRFP